MRVVVRVSPKARFTEVGGRYGDSEPPVLIIRVKAPAVDGAANEAMMAALAAALDVPRNEVRIVSGHRGRTKVVEVRGGDAEVLARLLLG